eukprot:gene23143-biopygen17787
MVVVVVVVLVLLACQRGKRMTMSQRCKRCQELDHCSAPTPPFSTQRPCPSAWGDAAVQSACCREPAPSAYVTPPAPRAPRAAPRGGGRRGAARRDGRAGSFGGLGGGAGPAVGVRFGRR